MKTILNTDYKESQVDLTLLIIRVGLALLMLTHGLPKLQMLFSGGEIQFPGMLGLSPNLTLVLAIFAEVLCSLLILLGLGTRLASIPLIITMLVAVFIFHVNDPFAAQELGLLYIVLSLPLLILGGGKYSFDHIITTRQNPQVVKSHAIKE